MHAPSHTLLLLALATLGLAGCVAGPDYTRPEPNAPGRWSELDAAADPATRPDATGDISRWWRTLGDPLLGELVEQALAASPDLRLARARLRQARAGREVAEADFWPSVSASGSASHGRSGMGRDAGSQSDQFSHGFDASWEVDLFGGVRRGVEAASADLESAAASLDDARVTLAAEVARGYVEVRALQIRLGIARRGLESQAETLQLTEWRAQAGLVSSQDVDQARSNREQTVAAIPALEVSLAQAEHALDVLLGLPPGSLHARLAAGGELPAVSAGIAVGIPAEALARRPDVRVAERKLAAETARVGVAEAARYPSLKLSGSIGVSGLVKDASGVGGGIFYSLLAGILAPIFDGGRLRAAREQQAAVREQAEIAYEQTVLVALQEVEDALVALARSRERCEALARAAEAARSASQLARQRYKAGMIDFQSVLDTERSTLSLEDSLATARADGVVALIRLYKALGGGWSPQAQAVAEGEGAR